MSEHAKFTIQIEEGQIQNIGQNGAGTEAFATPKSNIITETDAAIRKDLRLYPKALHAYELLTKDPEVLANWDMANYITMRKLGYNDHGRVHAWITGAASLAILELLLEAKVKPDIVESNMGDTEDAFLIVLLGTMLHDIGNQIHREKHEHHGVMLATPIVERILEQIYDDPAKRVKIRSFILHCINCHDLNPAPLTIEGGITAVADGSDITKGRGLKAFRLGSVDIHSLSALAIDEVRIAKGKTKPIEIRVVYNNSAGIFQMEEILAPKIIKTPLAPHVAIVGYHSHPEYGFLKGVELQGKTFVNKE